MSLGGNFSGAPGNKCTHASSRHARNQDGGCKSHYKDDHLYLFNDHFKLNINEVHFRACVK